MEPVIDKKASDFADAMVVNTLITVAQAADNDPALKSDIMKYINKIVVIGKKDGNPSAYYAAILILAEGITKADEAVRKDKLD